MRREEGYGLVGRTWYGSVDGRYASWTVGSKVVVDEGDGALLPDDYHVVRVEDTPEEVVELLEPLSLIDGGLA